MIPKATSTPKQVPVLQEKQANVKDEKIPTGKTLKETEKLEENRENPKNPSHASKSRKRNLEQEKMCRAIEAIKIQESRRQRMQGINVNSIEELSAVKPDEAVESRDEKLEKKRLEAKQQKEKRILKHLAEQEALKKKAEEEAKKFAPKRRAISNFHPRSPMVYRPRACCDTYSDRLVVFGGEPKVDIVEMLASPSMRQIHVKSRYVLRYTKDELRSLNPYGFYYM